ncbi:hypothetical protein PT974_06130 [Cladobotryum mycophilum]|uniref:Uncharacterized protein n=1 Tax=Cladobotryum mycophilum TaxID=491253 RepID=A0ABR0SLT4_9HYPO
MASIEKTQLVNGCAWINTIRPDGSEAKVKMRDCEQPTCQSSKAFVPRH